jgi:hypothetical protein
MRADLGHARWAVLALLAIAGALFVSGARAEVGAVFDIATLDPRVTYAWNAIIDDIDPTSSWHVLSVPTQGRAVLNPEGEANGDGKPSLWFDPARNLAVAVWARNSGAQFDVVLSRFAQGEWSTPVVIAGGAGDQVDPFVTGDPLDGTLHVVWVDRATGGVHHRWAPPDLAAWSAPQPVSPPGAVTRRPASAFDAEGLVVVWEAHDGGEGTVPRRIVFARRADGVFVEETVATTWHAEANFPEIHARGPRLWLEWIDADGEMAWRRQLLAGSWEPVAIEPYAGLVDLEYRVRSQIKALANAP